MSTINIWDAIDFSRDREETAYDLLRAQSEILETRTENLLSMDVEFHDTYLDTEPPQAVFIYPLFVVANHLGRYRKKILTVAQSKGKAAFPVDIHSHLDDAHYENVSKEAFLSKIAEILGRPEVGASIKNLYDMSKEKSQSQNRAS